MPQKHEVVPENAESFRDWITNRGGIAVWRSVNLANPGASWSTPALTEDGQPYPRPTWQADDKPEWIVMSMDDVVVLVPKEVKRFPVAIKRGDSMNITLTDGSSKRLRRAVARAGEGAWYQFDYSSQEAIILVPDKTIPLKEYSHAA